MIRSESLQTPMAIGELVVPNRVLLAPLAGVSDAPFRRICQQLGAGLTFVEMLSATAIRYRAKRTAEMIYRHPEEPILGVQVTGPDPDEIGLGVRDLKPYPFDVVDLNMGCPVRKIVGKGWGAALLREPERVEAIVRRVGEETSAPVTVKVRLGYTPQEMNIAEVAEAVARAGARALTIHGRTRADTYGVGVNYEGIRQGVEAARSATTGGLMLVGNGDVMNAASAARMLADTGCDAVMISRGALGNPWIFQELLTGSTGGPTVAEWEEVVLRHIDYHAHHYAEYHGAPVVFRKHLLWYLNGYPGAKKQRAQATSVSTMNDARDFIRQFARTLPPDLRRYDDKAQSLLNRPDASYEPKEAMDRSLDRGVGAEEG